ncbi:hotdog domain-containing protein [Caldimonas sp.]|uniref:acyl-CoA thioesterase n=1 Tax=Caldimonas sp. TaxID=2838790 RepID=UPI0029D84C9F|nr:acyl-CoA thioesterase [Caldimonas manganoxidans]
MPVASSSAVPAAVVLPTLRTVDMVWPDQSNHHGTLFGGAAVAMLDRLAYIVGTRALAAPAVTASITELAFAHPAPAGQLVEAHARVTDVGERSAWIEAELISEDLLSGQRTHCVSGRFVMVRPASSPPAAARTPAHETRADVPAQACTVADIVFPGHVNHRGILHGGPAMAWMSKAGFVAATRHSRRSVVMAGCERVDFDAPAHVGDIVEAHAWVQRTGRRSIQVQAQLWVESAPSGQPQRCATATMTYVALDP